LVQCESNLLGIANDSGIPVGSGGWTNIVEKYAKAKRYCDAPFETRQENGRKTTVPIRGEWIGERSDGARPRSVSIRCTDAAKARIEPGSLDAVFTDPPYFGNVQYGELMDFCYVWLKQLVSTEAEGFDRESTRSPDELTGNTTEARGLNHFAQGLGAVYANMARALKPGAPLAFTFHHNRLEAYCAVGVAILDAGLVCSATLPCPAEMGGSIHIHGTGSSIVDTIFVCRAHGRVQRSQLFQTAGELAVLVRVELEFLRQAGMKPTPGDIRCIVYGHLTRMAVWNLRKSWIAKAAIQERLARFAEALADLPELGAVAEAIAGEWLAVAVAETLSAYGEEQEHAVSF
jgi:putative DNA methylase